MASGAKQRTPAAETVGIRPPMTFLAPAPDPLAIRFAPFVSRAFVRIVHQVTGTTVADPAPIIAALRGFAAGKHRLIFAYRHQTHIDSPLLYAVLANDMYAVAREAGDPLPARPHVQFMYDRGLVLWAGAYLEWVLPRMGATPILRGKADRQGVTAARAALVEGHYPLAVSPEGGTNTLNYTLGPLQPGLVQLAAWAQDDLAATGQHIPVAILPIGIHYRYAPPSWAKMDAALTELETVFAVDASKTPVLIEEGYDPARIADPILRARYSRFLAIHAALLACLEDYFHEYYGMEIGAANDGVDARVVQLSDAAFRVAEERLRMTAKGAMTDRIYAIEQAAWRRIFRATPVSLVQKGLLDWAAKDAASAERYMRLASSLHRISLAYLFDNPSFERLADTMTLTWDVMTKAMGLRGKLSLGARHACINAGSLVCVAPATDRAGQKAAISAAQEALRQEMTRLTEEC